MDDIEVLREPITRADLKRLAERRYGEMVKAVVDCARRRIALGGELHSDEEQCLLDEGSTQADLWGINLYPDRHDSSWVEFDSVVNIRPDRGNRSRGVEDEATRASILAVVEEWIR
ncbi:MAG: DUF5674 family protein [Planctomycetes bacterium]|nr:DUF5674 family protein [Planctomycetota bacterium]